MRDIVARINLHKYVVWDYFVLFLILILQPKLQSYSSFLEMHILNKQGLYVRHFVRNYVAMYILSSFLSD